MTLRQTLEAKLGEALLGPADIEAIMRNIMAAESNEAMVNRWDDGVQGYPDEFVHMVCNAGAQGAIVWLEEHKPKHIALQVLKWVPVQPTPLGKLKPVKGRNG